MKNSGVYKIQNKANNKIYIGGVVDIQKRFHHHISELNHDRDHNKLLQSDWNEYGAEAFEFVVIELCASDELLKTKQRYLDELKPEYNISKIAGSNLGTKRSEEIRKKMSEARKKLWRDTEYRQRITRKNKQTWADPERRRRASEIEKQRWANPELRQQARDAMKKIIQTPEYQKKFNDAMAKIRSSNKKKRPG